MNDSIEFTLKEKYRISLYQDPEALFRRGLMQALCYLVPSVGLVAYSFISGDISYGVMGYGVLVFRLVYQISQWKKAYMETASIYRKYEAQLQAKQSAG